MIAIDINQERLDFAKSYAASDIYLPPAPTDPKEPRMDYSRRTTQQMQQELGIPERGFGGVDIVIEASGAEVCIKILSTLCKLGGRFLTSFH